MRRLLLPCLVLGPIFALACGGGDASTSTSSSSSSSSGSTTSSSASSTSGGSCTTPAQCDDKDPCTTDDCVMGTCSNKPVAIDDGVACTKDACDPMTGMIAHLPDDKTCKMGEYCNPVVGCTTKLANAVISELLPIAGNGQVELVEIYNPNDADAEITGFALVNGAKATAAIHAASDPTGKSKVIVPAKGFAYGVASPMDAASIPKDAAFVWGDPGTSWAMNDAGDVVSIVDDKAKVVDSVDFTHVATDPAMPIGATDFPAAPGVSMQLDASHLDAKANDDAASWCLTFRAPTTAGQKNHACDAYVVNEVLATYALPGQMPGTNQNTFLEIAGPAGGPLAGYRVKAFSGNTTKLDIQIGSNGLKGPTRMSLKGLLVIADGDIDNGTTNVPNADIVVGNAVPPSGGSNGQGIQVLDPLNKVLDALGYGPSALAETSPLSEVLPDTIAIAMARDGSSTDTNDNSKDFHYDPTPTPGLPNDLVAPKILGFDPSSPVDGLASTTTTVTLLAHDYADFKTVGGVAPMSNDVTGVFAGNAIADTPAFKDGCTIVAATQGGRGDVTVQCPVPANAGLALRGDVVLRNPTTIGGSDTKSNAWTYTTVNNGLAMGQADLCVLETPAMATAQQGMMSSPFLGQVTLAGTTPAPGPNPSVLAQVGYGKSGADPTKTSGFVFTTGTWTQQLGAADEYSAALLAPPVLASTSFGVVFRVSFDGGLSFTYCDTVGEGSTTMNKLKTSNLGTFVSTP